MITTIPPIPTDANLPAEADLHTVDARDCACPMPLLKAKRALLPLATGAYLRVLATDAGSARDIPAYCRLSGHQLRHFQEVDGVYDYILQKA